MVSAQRVVVRDEVVTDEKEDVMSGIGDWANKAKDLAGDHPDQVEKGIEQAGDFADDRTDDKYTEQVDRGQETAGRYLTGQEADPETQDPQKS
jgi:hypothetical protein